MPRPILQLHLHQPCGAIDDDSALAGEIGRGLIDARRIGEKHVTPATARWQVADIDHMVGEVLEEDARLHVVFYPVGDDVGRDFPEALVGVGECNNRLVGRCGRGQGGQQDHRPEQAERADPAGLHGDELAIGRLPPQTDEDAQQDRHRNRDAERLRQQRQEDARHHAPCDAFGDERLGFPENRRDLENEREHDQRQKQRQQDLADQIAVENLEHERWSRRESSFRLTP